jgi:hypothetical protein
MTHHHVHLLVFHDSWPAALSYALSSDLASGLSMTQTGFTAQE